MKFYKAFNKETSILCLDFSSNRISIRIMHPTELSVSPNYFWRGILKFQFLSINTNETTKKFLIFSKRLSKRLQKISKRQSKTHPKDIKNTLNPLGNWRGIKIEVHSQQRDKEAKKGLNYMAQCVGKERKKIPP